VRPEVALAPSGTGVGGRSSTGVAVMVVHGRRLYREMLAYLLEHTPGVGRVICAATVMEATELCREESFDVALVHAQAPSGDPGRMAAELGRLLGLRVFLVTDDPQGEHSPGSNGRHLSEVDPLERLVWAVTGRAGQPSNGGGPAAERGNGARAGLREAPALVPRLTPREVEVLETLAAGWSTDEAARALHISPLTLRGHVKNILAKLGAHSKLEAVTIALRLGLIGLPQDG
jgi:two-component system nitrate/nitrite response regulator NarL